MEQFEYLTTLLESSTRFAEKDKDMPRYSPKYLMPQLDEFGKQGWELISLEPVYTNKNQEVMRFRRSGIFADGLFTAVGIFTRNYLAVFKRRISFTQP